MSDANDPRHWNLETMKRSRAEKAAALLGLDPNQTTAAVEATREMLERSAMNQPPLSDIKEALGSRVKPDTTHVRRGFKIYCARASEYGDDKYERANYLCRSASLREGFEKFREYIRATIDHLDKTLEAMEYHQAEDPELRDQDGMKLAARHPDLEDSPRFRASRLPHIAHACASLMMGVEKGIRDGLIEKDPGRPWDSD